MPPLIVAVSPLVAERYGLRLRAFAPETRIITPADGRWPDEAQDAGVTYFSQDFWNSEESRPLGGRLFGLPNLRWFHSFSAGVDHPAFRSLLERGVLLSNSSGSSSPSIAQYVIGMMLRVSKRMDAWAEAQRERRWQPLETEELTGKTVGIVGVGAIGGEVARLANALGMRVIGLRRRQSASGGLRNVDELLPPERLHDLLAASDYVVLAVPLSTETDGMIGEAELRAMKPAAWLINIARGRVVREQALIEALRAGTIGGAVLDVFEEEPLPPESELWSLPNAIVTPHNSGWSPLNFERASELFVENFGRFVAGRPLRNRVRLRDL
jgi:phosphoglycerate dehydrogenase-like enzyme